MKERIPGIHDLIHLDEVDSTNTYAKRIYAADEDGVATRLCDKSARRYCHIPVDAVVADEQTAGRGRLGRVWQSQRGQTLVVTFVAYVPARVLRELGGGWLTSICGLACLDVLRELCDKSARHFCHIEDLQLKWPNDLYCAGKKLGGILCELVPGTATKEEVGVVFGVGTNLLTPPDQLPLLTATSLSAWLRGAVGELPAFDDLRACLVGEIARELGDFLGQLAELGQAATDQFLPRLREVSYTLGKRVEVRRTDGSKVTGVAQDILSDTALLVRTDAGEGVVVTSGDVGVL